MGRHFSTSGPLVCSLGLLLLLCARPQMSHGCFVEERDALMELQSALVRSRVVPPNSWGGGGDCCSWERVRCRNTTGRIVELQLSQLCDEDDDTAACAAGWSVDFGLFSAFHQLRALNLSFNSLNGSLRLTGVSGLKKLQFLDVSGNYLSGGIPMSLGNYRFLRMLSLQDNSFSGTIPSEVFRKLRDLRELHLGYNGPVGNIPPVLFDLPHLIHFVLSRNLLEGHIPISLSSNSTSLRRLYLYGNNFGGDFSFLSLAKLSKLQLVWLSNNQNLIVKMNYPEWMPPFKLHVLFLDNCTLEKNVISDPFFLRTQDKLRMLGLAGNNLPGHMPNWIFKKFPNLRYLALVKNQLVGTIDPSIDPLPSMKIIDLFGNFLAGQLPTNISSIFPNLVSLDISNSRLNGNIPSSFCNISSLKFLDLSNNKLYGEVPHCLLTNCTNLAMLNLSHNQLGSLMFGGHNTQPFLRMLDLSENQLKGEISRQLSGNQHLEFLDLHGNKISGHLPQLFLNLSSLRSLSLAGNYLKGEISQQICKLTGLVYLDLSHNKLNGLFPHCPKLLQLKFLRMEDNFLTGLALNTSFNMSNLVALDISNNQFYGYLHWIEDLKSIRLLSLAGNQFEGPIPHKLCDLNYLKMMDASQNSLWGILPPCVGNISFSATVDNSLYSSSLVFDLEGYREGISFESTNFYGLEGFTFTTKGRVYVYGKNFFGLMSGINLSGNKLSGEIPAEIGNLSNIKSLNLSYNSFNGQIPEAFSNLDQIESLDLSHNDLSGSIPQQLSKLSSLEVFSVAYNNLSGCIPSFGQFATFGMDSYEGNINLHLPLHGTSCNTFDSSPGLPQEHHYDGDMVLYAVVAASFVISFWITIGFLFFHSKGCFVRARIIDRYVDSVANKFLA